MILKFFWMLVGIKKLFWVHDVYLYCVETTFCSFWEIIFKVHYLWEKNETANGGWTSLVGIILHLWTGVDFSCGLTRYRMCFLEANVLMAVTFPAKKFHNHVRIPFANDIFRKWDLESASDDDDEEATLSSLCTVSGRSVCKKTCCQKGIDNVFLMTVSEHCASTSPLLQGHAWNT